MSLTRSNLSSVAFHKSAPKKSTIGLSGAIASSDLSSFRNSKLEDLHNNELSFITRANQSVARKSLLKSFPIRSGIGGIAGVSLFIFGHGILGLLAISYATIYGLSQFNSD